MDQIDIRAEIARSLSALSVHRSLLVGVSGIDASGKGYVAGRLASQLEASGLRVALINVDGWLNLPQVRFSGHEPPLPERRGGRGPGSWGNGSGAPAETREGRHFYHHALRLDEMFDRLILPLKQDREITLTMDFAEETASEFRPHTYDFTDIDIILLEGIFILKRAFLRHFDLKIWIDCGFDTALKRAVARGQENLPPEATVAAYRTIYFPAQRTHFETDDPMHAADVVFTNEED